MTRTTLSIRFVLILATVIGIHGGETLREPTLTVRTDFEDSLANREFRVDYPGIVGSASATIKIFQEGQTKEKVAYEISTDVSERQLLHFELKDTDAPAGLYEVQVCTPDKGCSDKRPAQGKILSEAEKKPLTCRQYDGQEENEFERFLNGEEATEISIKINKGKDFLTSQMCQTLLPTYKKIGLKSNPAYKEYKQGKHVFYAAVWYEGKHLKDLFAKIGEDDYCSRKYVFWASAHVVEYGTNMVKRRFRGTIIVNKNLAQDYILKDGAHDFPVVFARYDEEGKLPKGNYFVAVSFCASDKDRVNSSICSEAIYEDLHFDD